MRKRSRRSEQFQRAGAAPAAQALPPWHDGAWMPMASAVLLTLAFAPISQFYLAWIGLVPWLLYVRRAATARRLFLWNWGAGAIFSGLNIWWLGFVTIPGTLGSVAYMGLYWGLAAVIVRAIEPEDRGSRIEDGEGNSASRAILSPLPSILYPFLVAAVWTGVEWVRGNLMTGWPWSYLGYTQTPILPMCQVADLTGVFGVSFWLVATNALAAQFFVARLRLRTVRRQLVAVGSMLVIVLAYGLVRAAQTHTTPGPRVMVVQSNFPQSNSGEKGATIEQLADFHVNTTRAALQREAQAGRKVDMVVWSETMMPELNTLAREEMHGSPYGIFLEDTFHRLASLAFDFRTALLTGGEYAGRVVVRNDHFVPLQRANAAYLFEPTGTLSDLRYDKIHLVPFGEYVPFKESFPPLYKFFMWFSPYDFDYNLVPGKDDALTVFPLRRLTQALSTQPATSSATIEPVPSSSPSDEPIEMAEVARFVVPICFEDADPALLSRMFRPDDSRPPGMKRADFIVNITNDGWFSQPQLSQHLQIARFRSIENRVPTARSVNTGISAFIDSNGRVFDRLPAHVEGTLAQTLPLDPRVTIYTRTGDVFAMACAGVAALFAGIGIARSRRARRVVL